MFTAFFDLGDRYAAKSNWKDFALTKLCLFSMGLIAGTLLSEKNRKVAIGISSGVFLATYIPLMVKVLKIARESRQ